MGERLEGGNTGGAVRVGDTVRRVAGPWTPTVHALLSYLHDCGFSGVPRPLGIDELGREVLTFLPGETTGVRVPWPGWVRAEDTLDQVARWLRSYHDVVAGFVPPPGAVWRGGGAGPIIAHNDAGPYNAAWSGGRVVGFFDWDFAGPATREWDLAFAAFAWVPLTAPDVAAVNGFADVAGRPRRLLRFLEVYGFGGDVGVFVDLVGERLRVHAEGIRELALGDPVFQRLIDRGVVDEVERARELLGEFRF